MEELNNRIADNINSIIYQRYANGIRELSTKKLINYITKKYNIELDFNALSDILSANNNVESVIKDKIILGHTSNTEESDMDDDIHDTAVDEISNHMQYESVADALTSLKTGDIYSASSIQLNEDNLYYPLHYGSVKSKAKYIIGTVVPKKNLSESIVNCKIDKTDLFIELPIQCFIRKK